MTTINLQQQDQREELIKDAGRMNSGLKLSLVLLIAVAVSLGGLKGWSYYVGKKNDDVKMQILTQSESLNGKKTVDDVIDLQFRLSEIKKNLASKIEINDTLGKITKNVVPGIVFSSYVDNNKTVFLTMKSSNFDDISKQVFNFKKADFVSNVSVKGLNRTDKGVVCDVQIDTK